MQSTTPNSTEPTFFQRQSTTIKGILIFLLVLVLLIPAFMVEGVIQERESRQTEAVMEVSSKWGHSQTLIGPVLAVPYELVHHDDEGKELRRETQFAYFLPESLNVASTVAPEKRHRGIFDVVLYSSVLRLDGTFAPLSTARVIPAEATVQWGKAVLVLGIPDLRGLRDQVRLNWAGSTLISDPGIPVPGIAESGIHVPLALDPESVAQEHTFQLDVSLKGSGSLFFTPVGKVTEVQMESSWPDPSFTGAFLPDDKTISTQGFNAAWKVLNLNRNFPQQWNSDQKYQFGESTFGVSFLLPVDNYQKATRSVKYAILFIGLTFLCVFFIEMQHTTPVHPFQYALIGLALVIFYTLLVSISEHLPFNSAYFIAALMTIGMTGLYARSLFQSARMGVLVGGTLAALYGFLFVTLQQQDYALLIGSIGLFCILGIVMYFSRRINWYPE
ncbi:MAG: cell envelope integrity protein CreD [Bacteroidetes bacterium]|nr:MAG: cell envelope integrity protein CreD [Bacteroidota bacterium]